MISMWAFVSQPRSQLQKPTLQPIDQLQQHQHIATSSHPSLLLRQLSQLVPLPLPRHLPPASLGDEFDPEMEVFFCPEVGLDEREHDVRDLRPRGKSGVKRRGAHE